MFISLMFNKLKLYSQKKRLLEAFKVKDLLRTFYPFIYLNL